MSAKNFPEKPITMIIPFSAHNGIDSMSHVTGETFINEVEYSIYIDTTIPPWEYTSGGVFIRLKNLI